MARTVPNHDYLLQMVNYIIIILNLLLNPIYLAHLSK